LASALKKPKIIDLQAERARDDRRFGMERLKKVIEYLSELHRGSASEGLREEL
jgi:hypothetical protein